MEEVGNESLMAPPAPGRLDFQADGARLESARFELRLLRGASETPLTWAAEGEARRTVGQVQKAVDGATFERWEWTHPDGYRMGWTVCRLDHFPGFTLQADFYNGSSEPVRLREFAVARTDGATFYWEGRRDAWSLSSFTEPGRSLDDDPADRVLRDAAFLYTADGLQGLAIGAVGPGISDVRIGVSIEGHGLSLDVTSEMNDVVVAPGGGRRSEEVAMLAMPRDVAAQTLTRWIAATHGQRGHRRPALGWTSLNGSGQVSADRVIGAADAFKGLRDRVVARIIQVDRGYQKSIGQWEANDQFSAGWRPVIERIRGAGAAPGLWMAPLAVEDRLGHFERTPIWFLHGADGQPAKGGTLCGQPIHWLDATHPESRKHVRACLRSARASGFEVFRLDGPPERSNLRMHDTAKTRFEAARELFALCRDEIGERSLLVVGPGWERAAAGFADAVATGSDVLETWPDVAASIREAAAAIATHGALFWLAPGPALLREQGALSEEEWRTWHSFVGMLGGVTLVSGPVDDPSARDDALLRRLETLDPPANLGTKAVAEGPEWHRALGFCAQRDWGNFAGVLLWNGSDEARRVSVPAGVYDVLGERLHVWSYWDERWLGERDGSNALDHDPIAPHGCKVLRLTPVGDGPDSTVLVGSTLHASMGAVEVEEIAASARRVTITLTDAGARSGRLILATAGRLTLDQAEGCTVSAVREDGGVWVVDIERRRRNARQHIQLNRDPA